MVTQFSKCNNVFSFQNLSSMTITVINTPIEVSFATPSEIVTFLKKNINHDNNDDREEGSRKKREKRLGKQQVIPLSTLEIKKDEILLEIQLAGNHLASQHFLFLSILLL